MKLYGPGKITPNFLNYFYDTIINIWEYSNSSDHLFSGHSQNNTKKWHPDPKLYVFFKTNILFMSYFYRFYKRITLNSIPIVSKRFKQSLSFIQTEKMITAL